VYVRLFAPIRRHGSDRLSRERWGSGRDVWATEVVSFACGRYGAATGDTDGVPRCFRHSDHLIGRR
jgi:hypothetical protein